ncbi:AsmA family protein [Candidatus Accumulibacter phosphatis]|uniref:AsmA family protein n=3 Tax=Candidatus Accumulibacter TaxID=327159 RepID=C7RQ21_ACCRE|nr:AsmA family protein [Accumulibacter sp.]MBO3715553.1 AsmA family protein [Accumulibacter sp.]
MKVLRYAAIGFAAILGLAVLAIGVVALVFDANRYKADLVRIVQERTGRVLAIDGNLRLTFFPQIGVVIERLALSGPAGAGKFASVGEARLGLALLPLLTGTVVANHVELADLDVELVKRADGTTNFEDLAPSHGHPAPAALPGQPAKPVAPLALEIDAIRLRHATIVWRDEASGRSLRLTGFDARSGRIAQGARGQVEIATRVEASEPTLKVDLKGSAGYRLDFARGAFAFDDVDLRLAGDAPADVGLVAMLRGDVEVDPARDLVDIAKLSVALTTRDGLDLKASVPKLRLTSTGAVGEAASAELKLVRPVRTLTARLELSALAAEGKQVRFARLGAEAEVKQGETTVVVKLASPLAIDYAAHTADLSSLTGELLASGPQIPKKSAKVSLSGGARVAWGKPSSVSAELAAQLDDSNLRLKIAVADFEHPAIDFAVTADQLDVGRYLALVGASSEGTAHVLQAAGAAAPAAAGGQAAAPEKAIDLTALRSLNATGSVRIGALAVRHIKAENVLLGLRAAAGRIDIAPLNANLYQGTLAGSASVNAHSNQFSMREKLTGVALGPLLRDAVGVDRLAGRGSVALDLTTTGTTLTALKRALTGSVRIDVRDGAVKGVDLGAIMRAAGSLLGSKASVEGRAKATDQTEFSELSASFAIRQGVARSDDLSGQSPLLKVTGAGSIDIATERIDYLVKAAPVGAIPIGHGRTLTVLRGVAVPVRISGSLAAPEYSVDLAQLAVESAKTGVKLTIGAAVGAPEGAVPLVKDLWHGLRGKK